MKPTGKKIPDCSVYVPAFASYYQNNPSWGIFHVVMDDGNWAMDHAPPATQEERLLAGIFNNLTPSQRRKVAKQARVWFDSAVA